MDHNISLPVILSFVTLFIIVGVAIFQLKRVRSSQAKRGEHSGDITSSK